MKSKSPFSLYDFLGYLIPGSLCLYLLNIVFPIEKIDWLSQAIAEHNIFFENTIAFIVFAYVLGHAISYVSSVTVERFSIWTLGYPSKYMLEQPNKKQSYLLKGKKFWSKSSLWRRSLRFVLLPIHILDKLIGELLGFRLHYTNRLDDVLKTLIKEKSCNLKSI